MVVANQSFKSFLPAGVQFDIVADNAKAPPCLSRKQRSLGRTLTSSTYDSDESVVSLSAKKMDSDHDDYPLCVPMYSSPRPRRRKPALASSSKMRRPKFDRWVSDPDITSDALQNLLKNSAPQRSPKRSNASRPIRRESNGEDDILKLLTLALEECDRTADLVL